MRHFNCTERVGIVRKDNSS